MKPFEKFVESGYDPKTVDDKDIYNVATDWKVQLVPLTQDMSWQGQEKRTKEWPWVFATFVDRLQHIIWERDKKIEDQRFQIIELRKELSALKRAK